MEFYDEKDMEYWRKQADLGKAVILEIPVSMLLDLDIRSLSEKQGEKTSMDDLDAWLSRNRDDLEKALEYEKKEKKAVEMLEESLYDGSNSEKKKDESDHSKQTELSDAAAKVSRIMATETFSEDQIAVIAEAMLENLDSIVILTIEVGDNESAKYWLAVLNSLKNRGVKDILIICADGLTGIREAIQAAFPKTEYQRCIVHQVRNTLKYVADKDRKAFANDLKTIYNAPNEEQGRANRDRITEKWSEKFPNSMKRWERDWDVITPIFKFSANVRTVIYTTNAIESLNATYRKLNRQRSVFPSDQALLKALYLATFEATKKWTAQIVLHELDHLEGVII